MSAKGNQSSVFAHGTFDFIVAIEAAYRRALHFWGTRSLLLVRLIAMRSTCASVRFAATVVNIISLPPPSGYLGMSACYSPSWSD